VPGCKDLAVHGRGGNIRYSGNVNSDNENPHDRTQGGGVPDGLRESDLN
jgi:hypothetical protein